MPPHFGPTHANKCQNYSIFYLFLGQLLEADDEDYSVPVNSRPSSLPPPPPGLGGAPLSRLIVSGLNGGSPTNGAASPGSAHSAHSANSAHSAAAASNDPTAAARRRLPNRPQMPIFPQGTVFILGQ